MVVINNYLLIVIPCFTICNICLKTATIGNYLSPLTDLYSCRKLFNYECVFINSYSSSYFEVSILEVAAYVLWKTFDCLNSILVLRVIFRDISFSLYYDVLNGIMTLLGKCTLAI